jgi:hypothetical protein
MEEVGWEVDKDSEGVSESFSWGWEDMVGLWLWGAWPSPPLFMRSKGFGLRLRGGDQVVL